MKYVYDGDLTPTANISRLIEITAANAGEAVDALEQIADSLESIDKSLQRLSRSVQMLENGSPALRIGGYVDSYPS